MFPTHPLNGNAPEPTMAAGSALSRPDDNYSAAHLPNGTEYMMSASSTSAVHPPPAWAAPVMGSIPVPPQPPQPSGFGTTGYLLTSATNQYGSLPYPPVSPPPRLAGEPGMTQLPPSGYPGHLSAAPGLPHGVAERSLGGSRISGSPKVQHASSYHQPYVAGQQQDHAALGHKYPVPLSWHALDQNPPEFPQVNGIENADAVARKGPVSRPGSHGENLDRATGHSRVPSSAQNVSGTADSREPTNATASRPDSSALPLEGKPTLRRNQACLQCRRRKLRCDAGRPVCKTCIRSHAHAVRTNSVPNPVLECTYDEVAQPPPDPAKSTATSDALSWAAVQPASKKNPLAGTTTSDQRSGRSKRKANQVSRSVSVSSEQEPSRDQDHGRNVKRKQTSRDGINLNSNEGVQNQAPISEFAGSNDQTEVQSLQSQIAKLQARLQEVNSAQARPLGHLLENPGMPESGEYPVQSQRPQVPNADPQHHPVKPAGPSIYDIGIGSGWGHSGRDINVPYEVIAPVSTQTINSGPTHVKPNQMKSKVPNLPQTPLQTVAPDRVLLDILYPGWPPDLPDPSLMEHLIETFFTMVPSVPRLLHYDKFKSRMLLPPTHSNFPNTAVLHAICAASARYSARVFTVDASSQPWKTSPMHSEDPANEPDFGIKHSLYARRAIDNNLASGHCIYESAQALAILSVHWHFYARWVEGWVGIGMLGRLIVPLGLMSEVFESHSRAPALVEPASDEIDREERRALLWQAIIYDVQTSTSSGWPGAIQIDEVTTPLSAGLMRFDSGGSIPENSQTAHSPDLFTRHPVLDGFVMHIKVHMLLHRVNKFCRLWRATQRNNPDVDVDGRDTKEFRDLDGMIGTFMLTFPPSLRDPLTPGVGRVQRPLDIDLFATHVLLHQCIILLHEPFANLDDADDASTRRLLESSRAILRFVYSVTSTSLDLGYLVRCSFGFWTAARTLVLFLKYTFDHGTSPGGPMETLRSEIEVFRLTFVAQGTRFPIGARHLSMLENLLSACEGPLPGSHAVIVPPAEASTPAGRRADADERQSHSVGPQDGESDNEGRQGFNSSSWQVHSSISLAQLLDKKRGYRSSSSHLTSSPSHSVGADLTSPLTMSSMAGVMMNEVVS